MRRALPAIIVLILLALPAFAQAQFAFGADLIFRTTYVWRGVRRSDGPVLQPGLFASWLPPGWTITSGAWANVEVSNAEPLEFTDAGRSRQLAELDYWIEGHTRVQPFDLRFGFVYYDLQGNEATGGRGDSWDTAEVYGTASVLVKDLSVIGIAAAYDLRAIRGAYFALEALQHVPLVEVHGTMASLLFRLEVGANAGQQVDDPEETGYFAEAGITHIDGSGGARVHGDRFGVFSAWHWQFNQDPFTRRISLTSTRAHQRWLEAGVSVVLGAKARERR
jgi:hypothetical protein